MAITRSQEVDLEEFKAKTTSQKLDAIIGVLSRLLGNQRSDDQFTLNRSSEYDRFDRSGNDQRSGEIREGLVHKAILEEKSTSQFQENPEGQICNDEELAEIEAETKSIETKNETVKREADSDKILATSKDESMPQFQVPVSASKILRNVELEVDGGVERDQKMISNTNTGCAHKVLVKMPSNEKRIKHLKAWKFKFKTTSKRSKLKDDRLSFVEETALLNKDHKETMWDYVKKEFKETMAGCGMTRVDQRKKESEKERKWEDVRHSGSLQSYYDDHVKSTELVVRDQTQEVRSDVVYSPWVSVKRDGAVETQTCSSRRANHVWKPGGFVHPKIQLDWLERADSNHEEKQAWIENAWFKIQVHSDFDMASWVGLEIYGSETKKQTLLVVKLANRVWERGKLFDGNKLGVLWLKKVEPITWEVKKLEMRFMTSKQKVLLHGMKPGSVGEIRTQKLNRVQDDEDQISMLCVQELPRESEAEVFLLDGNSLVTTISLEVDQLLRQFHELFEKLSLVEMKLRMIGRVWKSFGYWMEDMMEEDRKRRRQQKFHKTRQSKFIQQPRRNMVYTPCLRILRRGKEHGRSTQVKLFKNWKFKYKHKHPLRILSCNAQHKMKQMADQQRTEREFAIGSSCLICRRSSLSCRLTLRTRLFGGGRCDTGKGRKQARGHVDG